MRQPFSGTAERIFMKLLPNDRGKMYFSTSYPNGVVYAGSLLYSARMLKNHERANGFNLVFIKFR